jgi:DNA-binding MarR family transcriptional regulator
LRDRLTWLLGRVAAAAGKAANAKLADLGLDTRHYSALAVIAHADGPSQQTVAALLGADRATVVALVDQLQHRGLVRRATNPLDRRAHALHATAAGRRLLERADRLMDQCERDFLAGLEDQQRAALAATLQALLGRSEPTA